MNVIKPATLTADAVAQAVVATVLAGIVGYFAILWLIRIVRSGRIWYFSVYLFVVGVSILAAVAFHRLTGPWFLG